MYAQKFFHKRSSRFRWVTVAILAATISLFCEAPQTTDSAARRGEQWRSFRKEAKEAHAKSDWSAYRAVLVRQRKEFPYSAQLLLELAAVEVKLSNNREAVSLLKEFERFGLAPALDDQTFSSNRNSPGWQEVVSGADFNKKAIHKAERLFSLDAADFLAEDIASDPASNRLLVSSVRQGRIISCTFKGQCTDFLSTSAAEALKTWAILALFADTRHNVLWASTVEIAGAPRFQSSDHPRTALLKFDLRSRRLLARYELEDGGQHALGDLTVSSKGDVYVSDGLSGNVYVLLRNDQTLQLLVPAGTFYSPQTPALSSDESVLFVPDYALGIATVNLHDRTIQWMNPSPYAALHGIDGMCSCGDDLIAVQNGVTPERVIRIEKHGSQLGKLEVLESNSDGLGDPTHVIPVGPDVLLIANSGWERFGDAGDFKPGTPPEVRRIHLRCNSQKKNAH